MDLLLGSLPDILSTTANVLFAAAVVPRLLFLLAIALSFVPKYEHRMLKLLEVATPLIRKSAPYGFRRHHERVVVGPLMLLAMFPWAAKTALRVLAILNS